ncbi:MAG: serine/threonine protein kinase [Planctomycetes bacterium]|nr:serine/threonine protein kinase [Planctomycetota bacterium]
MGDDRYRDFYGDLFGGGSELPSPLLEKLLVRLAEDDGQAWLATRVDLEPVSSVLAASRNASSGENERLDAVRKLACAWIDRHDASTQSRQETEATTVENLLVRLVLESFLFVMGGTGDATMVLPLGSGPSALVEVAVACESQPVIRDLLLDAAHRQRPARALQRVGLPHHVGDYRIDRRIGGGAMGQVYVGRARDGTRVAIKVLRFWIQDRATEKRFAKEIEILGALDHPSIARISGSGTTHDAPYHVTEFVEGVDLLTYARNNALSLRDRLRLLVKVCDAVDHAHVRGIVHRDLKPSNILVKADGTPKVLDFGIAMRFDSAVGEPSLTDSGALLGTPGYMSPEQCLGARSAIGPHSDVYALGVLLYELVSGVRPHDTTKYDPIGALRVTVTREPRRLDRLGEAPLPIVAVAGKAVARRSEQRYANAGRLAEELRRYLGGQEVEARLPSFGTRLVRRAREHRIATGIGAMLLVGLLGGTWLLATKRAAVAAQKTAYESTRVAYESLIKQVDRAPPVESIGVAKRVLERIRELELEARSPELERIEALVRGQLGGLYVRTGERELATLERDACLLFWKRWIESHPADTEALGRYSIAIVERGDLEKHEGRLDSALAYYEQALGLDEQLVEIEPDSRLFCDNLIWSYLRLGEFRHEENIDLIEAARWYRKAHEAAMRLAALRPDCIPTLWTLSHTHTRLFNLLSWSHGLAAIKEQHVRAAYACVERLALVKPGNGSIAYQYTSVRLAYASILMEAGDLNAAERVYVTTIHDVGQAVHGEPESPELAGALAMAYTESIGNLLVAGEEERARERYAEMLDKLEGIALLHPNVRDQVTFAQVHNDPRFRDLARETRALAQWDAAVKRYEEACRERRSPRNRWGFLVAISESPRESDRRRARAAIETCGDAVCENPRAAEPADLAVVMWAICKNQVRAELADRYRAEVQQLEKDLRAVLVDRR